MKTTIFLLFTCLTLFAQGQYPNASGRPNNSYGWYKIVPNDATGAEGECYWFVTNEGYIVPVEGMPVTISSYTTVGSAGPAQDGTVSTADGHAHDCPNCDRPQVQLSLPYTQNTGSNGCVLWNVIYPSYAGYVTFEFKNAAYQYYQIVYPARTSGVNALTQSYGTNNAYMSQDPKFPTTFPKIFQEYVPLNVTDQPYDYGHAGSQLTAMSYTIVALIQAAADYENNAISFLGYDDMMTLRRMQIQLGGLLDDDTSFTNPEWNQTTRWNEEHGDGYRLDIQNASMMMSPIGTVPSSLAGGLEMQAMENHGCNPGVRYPSFDEVTSDQLIPLPVENWWVEQDVIHFDCVEPIRHLGAR
jgi:hypothetical protein